MKKFDFPQAIHAAGRLAMGAAAITAFSGLLSGGTPPMRMFHLLGFFLGILNPWWGFCALALIAPIFILDPGQTHRLGGIEAIALGILLGHARAGAPRPEDGANSMARPTAPGVLNYIAWAIAFGVVAAVIPALQLAPSFFQEQLKRPPTWPGFLSDLYYGYATSPTWGLRSAYNWLTGLLLCWTASKWVNASRARSLWGIAAAGMVVSCAAGLAEWAGVISLAAWRPPNADLIRMGSRRLLSLAGHSGWFSEWILLTWPGILLLASMGKKGRAAAGAAAGLAALSLTLALQRAGWLGGAAAVIFLIFHSRKAGFLTPRRAVWGLVALLALCVMALSWAGPEFLLRAVRLFRFRDRLNYFISGYRLLRESPAGIGIGLHASIYDSMFTPFHRAWQSDHATAHNTWLHILIEQGAPAAFAAGCGFLAVLWTLWRRIAHAPPENRLPLLAFFLALLAIAVDSFAQYLGYIRIIEVITWTWIGCAMGLSHPAQGEAQPAAAAEPILADSSKKNSAAQSANALKPSSGFPRWAGLAILAVSGCAAAAAALYHVRQGPMRPYPRPLKTIGNPPGIEVWTPRTWRFPLEPTWCGVEFCLKTDDWEQEVEIRLPGHPPHKVHLVPGKTEGRYYLLSPARGAGRRAPMRFLEIRCKDAWTPARLATGNPDRRRLSVLVYALRPLLCDEDSTRPPWQRWKESDGPGPGWPEP